jgi:hypothetical protein
VPWENSKLRSASWISKPVGDLSAASGSLAKNAEPPLIRGGLDPRRIRPCYVAGPVSLSDDRDDPERAVLGSAMIPFILAVLRTPNLPGENRE